MKTSKHPKLANGQPAISCYTISQAEVIKRLNLARARAEALAAEQQGRPDLLAAAYLGRYLLWHTEFPNGLRLTVCDNELFRLTADLPSLLLEMNGGQALDFFDYGYLADLLREWLLDSSILAGELLNLRRALAWVEQRGSGLRDYNLEPE